MKRSANDSKGSSINSWADFFKSEPWSEADSDLFEEVWSAYWHNASAEQQQRLRDSVDAVLSTVTPRQRRVLQMRFGLLDGRPMTLQQVANHFKLSRERIRQIQVEALKRVHWPSGYDRAR